MTVRRIMPYHESPTRGHAYLLYAGARARGGDLRRRCRLRIWPGAGRLRSSGAEPVLPDMGVDVDSRGAVDARTLKQSEQGTRSSTVRLTSRGASVASSSAIRTVCDQRAGPRIIQPHPAWVWAALCGHSTPENSPRLARWEHRLDSRGWCKRSSGGWHERALRAVASFADLWGSRAWERPRGGKVGTAGSIS